METWIPSPRRTESCVGFGILSVTRGGIGHATPSHDMTRQGRRFVRILAAAALLAAVGLVWLFGIEPAILTVTRVAYSSPDLPPAWSGRTVAFFSDLHAGPGFPLDQVKRVVERIRAESPDLVVFGGDLVDSATPLEPAFLIPLSDLLSEARGRLGSIAVLGNHDNRLASERQAVRTAWADAGFVLLENQSIPVDGIRVGGLAESYFGRPDYGAAFGDTNSEEFRILAMHQPDPASAFPAHIVLSGHTHGGQVTLFGYPLYAIPGGTKHPYGRYDLPHSAAGGFPGMLFVSRGLGTFGIRARFFSPPEIVLIRLARE